MASLTIRNLDEAVKQGLRRRAAERGVSLEEEARAVLRAAALAPPSPRDLGAAIRGRFAPLGGVELGESVDDRERHLAHELPAEWVAELEKPVPPYETPLDDMVDEPRSATKPAAEARERARRAAQTMDELSRGLTLDGLSLRELIGRDRQ